MTLTASIQWLVPTLNTGCLRVYEAWLEPPTFVATVRRRGDVVKVYAALGKYDRDTHLAVAKAMTLTGVRRVYYSRYSKAKRRMCKIEDRRIDVECRKLSRENEQEKANRALQGLFRN